VDAVADSCNVNCHRHHHPTWTNPKEHRIVGISPIRHRRSSDEARTDERLLAAARTDNEELLLDVFDHGNFDINCQDGLVLECFNPCLAS
jgi:hypothetical protein